MTALPQDVVADLRRENARLQAELRAARDRQAGSAEILRTIGSASGDAEQSLHQIAETTKRLFEASSVTIFVAEGDDWGRIIHDGPSSQRIGAEVPVAQLRIGGHSLPGAAFSENRQIHLPDIDNVDPAIADWPGLRPARAAGTRTLSGTPLRRAGQAVGFSPSTATGSRRLPPRSSPCCKPSQIRRPSPSRTRGCSTRPRRCWSGKPRRLIS